MPDRYLEANICPVSQIRLHTCRPLTCDLTQGPQNNLPANKSVTAFDGGGIAGGRERERKRKGGHMKDGAIRGSYPDVRLDDVTLYELNTPNGRAHALDRTSQMVGLFVCLFVCVRDCNRSVSTC